MFPNYTMINPYDRNLIYIINCFFCYNIFIKNKSILNIEIFNIDDVIICHTLFTRDVIL